MRKSLIFLFCFFSASFCYGKLIPVEEFTNQAAFKGFQLSPDGNSVAYSETIKGINILRFLDLKTGKKFGVNLLSKRRLWNQRASFQWISNNRLIYRSRGGFEAVNRDGSKGRPIYAGAGLKLGGIVRNLRLTEEEKLIIVTYDKTTEESTSSSSSTFRLTRPGLAKIDSKTGSFATLQDNPGNIVRWLITWDGSVLVAQEIEGTRYRVVYRNPAATDEQSVALKWIALPGMDWDDPQVRPLGYGDEDRTLYVSRLNEYGRWAVYPYDLKTHKFGAVILENKKYDIIPQTDIPGQTGMVYSPDQKRLLGINYQTAYPRVYWLDQGLREVQAGLDQALKGKVNTITSMSDNLQKLIIHSSSDRDPGTYYFFDREKKSLSILMKNTPWINEEQMARMRPIKFEARDGITINGYLTLPVGIESKNLPLIVLNNGSYSSRNTWYFDRNVQFFANRGYAILRVNARGTTGYGDAFKRMGYGKTEESVADLADGVQWAVNKGLVDAKRVAVMGEGGFSGIRTLSALALQPDVYACGVVNAPFTDWREVIHRDRFIGDALTSLRERIGDPRDPNDPLSRMSPVQMVDQIIAPVLVTETSSVRPYYYTFVKKFVKALKSSGSKVEFETKYKDRFGYNNYAKWLTDIETFLARYMPADQ